MGQCYTTTLRIRFKDTEEAKKATREWMAAQERTHFNEDKFREEGVNTDTIGGLIQVIFAGWKYNNFLFKVLPDGRVMYTNDFNACYGWESVMMDWFDAIAPYAEDGSELVIYPDSGMDHAVVENGKAKWLS